MQASSTSGHIKLAAPVQSAAADRPVVESASESESSSSRGGRDRFEMMSNLVNRGKTQEHVIPSRRNLVRSKGRSTIPVRRADAGMRDESGSESASYDSEYSEGSRQSGRQLEAMNSMAREPVLMQLKEENERMKAQLSAATSLQEKGRLIQRLKELDAQGYKGTKPFHTAMSQQELTIELSVAEASKTRVETGDNMRQLLIMGVGAVEYANRRYLKSKVFQLDGWTQQVSGSIASFDRPLNRLAEKYGKVGGNIEPEWELLIMLTGSAMMFHITKQFAQQNMPSMLDVANSNPELADAIARIMAERMAAEAEEGGASTAGVQVQSDSDINELLRKSGMMGETDITSAVEEQSMPALSSESTPVVAAVEPEAAMPRLVEAESYAGLRVSGESADVPKSDTRTFMLPVPDYMRRPAQAGMTSGPMRMPEDDAASTTSGGRRGKKGISFDAL